MFQLLVANKRRHTRPMKEWTLRQAETAKRRAERFLRDVLIDDIRADEVSAESIEDYAARRGFTIVESNPTRLGTPIMQNMTKAEMAERIEELENELDEANDKLSTIGEILGDEEDETEEDESEDDESEEDESDDE